MANPRMPTGMFSGRRIAELPDAYLALQSSNGSLPAYVRTAIAAELRRRLDAERKRARP